MSASAEATAVLAGVSHRYGSRRALRAVDFSVGRGEWVGVIGPDGVGKSTLLGLLAGAKRLQSGAARALGGDLADAAHRQRICPRIAYMPQGLGRNLYPDLSVAENIAFFSRLFGQSARERRGRTASLLAATGLAPFAGRAARQLSGGMRQKLALCCALIHDPDLLILDEPTTGVDPLSRRQFWALLASIRAARPALSVVVATAYMSEAEPFDRLVALNDGVVLAQGSPADIKRKTGCATLDASFVVLLGGSKAAQATASPDAGPPDASAPVAICASGLTRRFGDFLAVDHVSFAIRRGEIFGFLGSNGCGKTTTMRMLTGLLAPTEGSATLFGNPIDPADRAAHARVGYMSQSFSLYTELTVRQNLVLHAKLYRLPPERAAARIASVIETFALGADLDAMAGGLPLGIRQRLSLAVAVVHEPELLILDEPTSGVDPLARDRFWVLLRTLARRQGVTIFVSTHFMDEAERCDRVALMHAGRVLASGAPAQLVAASGEPTLEAAFVALLLGSEVAGSGIGSPSPVPPRVAGGGAAHHPAFSLGRLLAFARREALELMRDPIRLGFAVLGTMFLFIVLGFGVNTDVDHLPFAALDRDRTPESRLYLQGFAGSPFFEAEAPAVTESALARRLESGAIMIGIEIPPGFGRDVRRGAPTEIGIRIDGAMPFRAETARGYVEAVHDRFLQHLAARTGRETAPLPANIEARFRYNQSFESVNALVPGDYAMLLALIPAVLMALAVVREKELGSIVNLYVTPATRLEFLVGKQLPYVGLAMASAVMLAAIAALLFGVPIKGSAAALLLGTLLYVFATTAYGLLMSSFASSQIAALFATAILTVVPAQQFSGLISPVSALTGFGALLGRLFPMSYYLPISLGSFTKGLGFADLLPWMLPLSLFTPALIGLSLWLMRAQER